MPDVHKVGQIAPVEDLGAVDSSKFLGVRGNGKVGETECFCDKGEFASVGHGFEMNEDPFPFPEELYERMIAFGSFPVAGGGELAQLAAFDLQNQQAAAWAQDQKIAFMIGVVIESPADGPGVGEFAQGFCDDTFAFATELVRTVVDPLGHGVRV